MKTYRQLRMCEAICAAIAGIALSASSIAQVRESAGQLPGTPGATKTQPKKSPIKAKAPHTLGTVIVTGSHIPAAELANANPVVAVTAEQIAQSGQLNAAQVIQNLPNITGAAITPHQGGIGATPELGGGTGQTLVGLRGLGASRTLILVDGHRVLNKDLSTIPAAAIERVEVLTSGAGAIYGSDAIGGVINFILKSDYNGAEASVTHGISSHGDGQQTGVSFMFGHSYDKGSFVAALSYNKTDPIPSADRSFMLNSFQLTQSSDGKVTPVVSGLTFNPYNAITLPESLASMFGCSVVSLNHNATGVSPTTLSDYHCYNQSTDGSNTRQNVELGLPTEDIQLSQERSKGYLNGVVHLTSNIDAYFTGYHVTARSSNPGGFLATSTSGGLSISASNYYNPFGIDFTPTNGNEFDTMQVSMGVPRVGSTNVDTDQMIGGVRGRLTVFGRHWRWNVGYNYGRVFDLQTEVGFPNIDVVNQELGPSMSIDGSVQCVSSPGDPSAVIPGCTPFDPFNTFSPSARAALKDAGGPESLTVSQIQREKFVGANGGLFDLPAGEVQLALGADWRSEYQDTSVAQSMIIDPATGFCALGSQCFSPLHGGFSVKEAYAELFVPVISDAPGISGLSLDLGDRYSKYSTFGSTNNWKIGLEYRPVPDLLLRGSVSKLFRAPTIEDEDASPVVLAPLLTSDPCDGIAVANPACVGVPLNGAFRNKDVQNGTLIFGESAGAAFAHFPLGPEDGKSFDFGTVYSPHYVPGLVGSLDFWRIYLNNVITNVGAQDVLDLCFLGQEQYCPLIHRFIGGSQPGEISNIVSPTTNLGRIDVKGVDAGVKYRVQTSSLGNFDFGVNGTYLSKFQIETAPGLAGNQVLQGAGMIAGTGSPLQGACPFVQTLTACFMPRIKGQGFVNWQLGPLSAQWRLQYTGPFRVGSPDPAQGDSIAIGSPVDAPVSKEYGSMLYNDFSASYDIRKAHLTVSGGINNAFNRVPPYVFSVGVPVNYFDVIGRYYWIRLVATL